MIGESYGITIHALSSFKALSVASSYSPPCSIAKPWAAYDVSRALTVSALHVNSLGVVVSSIVRPIAYIPTYSLNRKSESQLNSCWSVHGVVAAQCATLVTRARDLSMKLRDSNMASSQEYTYQSTERSYLLCSPLK